MIDLQLEDILMLICFKILNMYIPLLLLDNCQKLLANILVEKHLEHNSSGCKSSLITETK